MEGLSLWLSQTTVNAILREQLGFLAALQAIHIMAVAMVGSSVLMIDLRLLGLAERSQTGKSPAASCPGFGADWSCLL
jgi:hypothetical protein